MSGISDSLPPVLQNLNKKESVSTALEFLGSNGEWINKNSELAKWCFKQIESHDLLLSDPKTWETYQYLLRHYVTLFPLPQELDQKHVLHVTLGALSLDISRNRFAKEGRLFQRLIRPDMKEGQTGQVELKPDLSKELHQKFLQYLEMGTIELTGDNVLDFLKLAEYYDLMHLTQECLKYLIDNLQIDEDFQDFLLLAKSIENPQLRSQCLLVGIKVLARSNIEDPFWSKLEALNNEDKTLKGLIQLAKIAKQGGYKFRFGEPSETGVVPIVLSQFIDGIGNFSPSFQFPFPVSLEIQSVESSAIENMHFPPEIRALKIDCEFDPPIKEFSLLQKLSLLENYQNIGLKLRNFDKAKQYLSEYPLRKFLKRVDFMILGLNDQQLEELIKLVPEASTLIIYYANITKIPHAEQFTELVCIGNSSLPTLNLPKTKSVELNQCNNTITLKLPESVTVSASFCPKLKTIEAPKANISIAGCQKLKK